MSTEGPALQDMTEHEREENLTPELAQELREATEYRHAMRHFTAISPNHWCHRRYRAALTAAEKHLANAKEQP